MRASAVSIALLAGALVSCGESPCEAPAGCLRADRVDGACQCFEWQVVSVENVPVKFVVVSVVYDLPGN
ncbi:MAG TPA: hypothetical protein VIV59_00400, partial [Anaeromyxobacteraceae bacterium]